jgi:alanyl-tRNA synthetase
MFYRSGSQIREDFLRFFETKQHRRVHSSSLVPSNDPTLLFTNAGMNQFKDVFLGSDKRDYARATTSQKCVRAGGKHNDLENVGFTRRHHTFFEMLGNFSFGDYFKKDAIAYAWELLTSPEWFGISKDKLYVTIFEGDEQVPRDDEAEQFWIEAGVPKERIFEMSAKDNFWQMGETGPCGPCSEIYFDLGLEAADEAGVDKPFPLDEQRYVEIWNLVFMQFDRTIDAATGGAQLTPLPKPSIDTGMGLERIACVLQGVTSNFETDLFVPLIKKAAELTDTETTPILTFSAGASAILPSEENFEKNKIDQLIGRASLRIIADHARSATFLIADGVEPSNEGRGYVLRKILRRAIQHGYQLGKNEPFLFNMAYAVMELMKHAYPELESEAIRVSKIILREEEQFARTLALGSQKLRTELANAALSYFSYFTESVVKQLVDEAYLDGEISTGFLVGFRDHPDHVLTYYSVLARKASYMATGGRPVLLGKNAFRLFETFGMPLDFMTDAARDAGIEFDLPGFEAAKEEEQARARASWKGGSQKTASPIFRELAKTDFLGYHSLRADGAKVIALVKDGVGVNELHPGDKGEVVLDATSFYADSGGQVGDTGWLFPTDHTSTLAEVHGCTKPVQGVFAHKVTVKRPIAVGDTLDAVVNGEVRSATIRNHTGTHLLHAALREVLGTHVKQAGSLVDPSKLRFDFSHYASIADEELQEIEDIINSEVLKNVRVQTIEDVPIDVAVNEYKAMALFGEKYGDKVRVVKIGDFSTELCGGIHTGATGEIGLLKLVGESSAASGIRRVEAVTGTGSLKEFRRDFDVARVASRVAGVYDGDASPAMALQQKLTSQEEELKKLRRELDQARMKSASASTADAASQAVEVKGVKVLAQRVSGLDRNQMRTLVDNLRTKLGEGVVVLGTATEDGKVALIAGVTKELTGRVQAGKVVGALAVKVGGKGGGRPDLAEAGGSDVSQLDAALAAAAQVIGELLG